MAATPPETPEAVQESVRQARSDHRPLHIFGNCTKAHLGCRIDGLTPLDVSGLDEVVDYDPGELTLVARPGLHLRTAEELLAGEHHHLAFEPPRWGAEATIGGTVACNLSGPRRFKAGALRDYILGIEMIDGHGERIRAGGRVVKNVSGYDLSKVLSGSFGTLGVLTEVCLKLWPRPETQQTLVVHGQEPAAALPLMLRLAALPCEITGLAHLPGPDPTAARTLARVEGPAPAVTAQIDQLYADIAGECSTLAEEESMALWKGLRELEPFQPAPEEQLWRFSIPPSRAADLLESLRAHDLERFGLDWGGGLLWALLPAASRAASLHQLATEHQGMAWRFAASSADPNTEAFTPSSVGVARLHRTLKHAFDPEGIFNPGRMGES